MTDLLHEKKCIDLKNGEGISDLRKFQEHFREYKIVLYSCLNCESIMYQGHIDSHKRINLLFDEGTQHYHLTHKLTEAMGKRYVCDRYN